MKLENLGYNANLDKFKNENDLTEFEIGRVIAEHKESYVVNIESGELQAEITGHLRFSAREREDFPAVGDWVALSIHGSDFSLIHAILPRWSIISRRAVGRFGDKQIIASNVDYAFIIQAVDRDFNVNRIERYLTICHASKVTPIIVLTKIDLINEQELAEKISRINQRIENILVFPVSNNTRYGYEALNDVIEKGKTYCMLGSSGVGKSTLINNLSGRHVMKTDAISNSTNKGRHITTHRELIVLDGGGILVDNPGMREVGIVDDSHGLETTFDKVLSLSQYCKFKDCTHSNELGCAIIEAVEKGEIDKSSYASYMKMEREKAYFESTVAERRNKDKNFGKMLKNYKKETNKTIHPTR